MRRILVICVMAVVLAGVQIAQATPAPDFFNVYGCSLHGGQVMVAAGTPLQARGGWAGEDPRSGAGLPGRSRTSLSVDGEPAMAMAYGPITHSGPGDWECGSPTVCRPWRPARR